MTLSINERKVFNGNDFQTCQQNSKTHLKDIHNLPNILHSTHWYQTQQTIHRIGKSLLVTSASCAAYAGYMTTRFKANPIVMMINFTTWAILACATALISLPFLLKKSFWNDPLFCQKQAQQLATDLEHTAVNYTILIKKYGDHLDCLYPYLNEEQKKRLKEVFDCFVPANNLDKAQVDVLLQKMKLVFSTSETNLTKPEATEIENHQHTCLPLQKPPEEVEKVTNIGLDRAQFIIGLPKRQEGLLALTKEAKLLDIDLEKVVSIILPIELNQLEQGMSYLQFRQRNAPILISRVLNQAEKNLKKKIKEIFLQLPLERAYVFYTNPSYKSRLDFLINCTRKLNQQFHDDLRELKPFALFQKYGLEIAQGKYKDIWSESSRQQLIEKFEQLQKESSFQQFKIDQPETSAPLEEMIIQDLNRLSTLEKVKEEVKDKMRMAFLKLPALVAYQLYLNQKNKTEILLLDVDSNKIIQRLKEEMNELSPKIFFRQHGIEVVNNKFKRHWNKEDQQRLEEKFNQLKLEFESLDEFKIKDQLKEVEFVHEFI